MGVTTPQPGYLDPHLLVFKSSINTICNKKIVTIFQNIIVIKLIPLVLNKKIFSHVRLGIRGGGQDTPAGVS